MRDVMGCAWVRLGQIKRIFRPNLTWWVKKNPSQPNSSQRCNPIHMDRVGSGWTHGLAVFLYIIFITIIITIIINLSRKNKYIFLSLLLFINLDSNLVINKTYPTELIKKKNKIYELLSQLSYKQIRVKWECESGRW